MHEIQILTKKIFRYIGQKKNLKVIGKAPFDHVLFKDFATWLILITYSYRSVLKGFLTYWKVRSYIDFYR